MTIRVETHGIPVVFYNPETRKYSARARVEVDGEEKIIFFDQQVI